MAADNKRPKGEPEQSFESLFGSLEEKARKLESGNLPLEESLRLYEEGAGIADRLREILDNAELRMRALQVRLEEDRSTLREIEATYGDEDE
ncbi:MAG: exodeoxyribonuclease VII small subunit [Dehalococcoidia bacterium]